MKNKKLASILCLALTASVLMSGCSSTSSGTSSSSESASVQDDAASEEEEEESDAVTAQITSIDGSTITATVGTLTTAEPGDSEVPEKPEGTDSSSDDSASTESAPEKPADDDSSASDSNASTKSAPEKPADDGSSASDSSSTETPPEKPNGDGEAPDGQKPGGSTFEAGTETITFTVTDGTAITVEFLQGSQEGTLEDLAENQVIEVTLDDDNQATALTVKNLQAGGGFGGSGEVTNGTSAASLDDNASVSGETYTSTGDDENALRADGVTAELDGVTIEKTAGESSNTEDGDFYGQNAGFLALNGATVTIKNADVSTSAINGNGVFSYGEGTTVNISDSTIHTTMRNSGGIQTTGGATTNAENLTISTEGDSSAAIRSDRGGGTVNVDGGTYTTDGLGSPAVYSTADITVKNATLTANNSEGLVIEGKNSIALENCTVSGNMTSSTSGSDNDNLHAVMIYQSMSGDADLGESSFSSNGGSIISLSGDLFYVTNTSCSISLTNTKLVTANGQLFTIAGNNSSRGWGTEGSNGGNVTLTTSKQTMDGDITVDDISMLDLSMSENSSFTGTINSSGEAGEVNVTLDDTSTWTLTGDSYVTSFTGDVSQITANGYHLYVDGTAVV